MVMRRVLARSVLLAFVLASFAAGCERESATKKWEREQNYSEPGDDPRFKAAEAEARRRWPEFVVAFSKREPNVAYAVKAKFTDGQTNEWMWVQVKSITGNTVTGVLDNEPIDVKNVRVGQTVTKTLAEIDDWIVGRDGRIAQGGFTTKAMEQIEAERRAKKQQ